MTLTRLAFAAAPILALTLAAAAPAQAQSGYYDRHYDQRRDNSGDVVAGVVIGAIAGGLLASAASDNGRGDCGYYRDNRCWRNQGHWEREHGINSRYGYGYNDRRDYRYDRRDDRYDRRYDRRDDRRDYRYDRRW